MVTEQKQRPFVTGEPATKQIVLVLYLALVLSLGCSASKEFAAIPEGLDRANVPTQSVAMTAERFHYTPEEVHVRVGTLVHLEVKSIDGTHGFKLAAFGIDETIEEGETKTIEFYAQAKGEYPFRCSHFCGLGHFGMSGKVVVE